MIFVKRYNIFTSEEHNLMHNLMEKIAYAAIASRKLKRKRLNWQCSWSCFAHRKTTKDKWIICVLLSQSHYSSNRRILLGSFRPQSIKAMYVLFMKFICPNNAFKTRVRKMLSIWFYASLQEDWLQLDYVSITTQVPKRLQTNALFCLGLRRRTMRKRSHFQSISYYNA